MKSVISLYPNVLKGLVLTLVFSVTLSGCAGLGQLSQGSEQDVYDDVQEQITKKNYDLALERLALLDELFPFGAYSEQAKLDRMFVLMKKRSYTEAAVLADRFTRLNPDHEGAAYAYYIRGRATFESAFHGGNFFSGNHPERRDTSTIKQAFRYFDNYLNRFPEGEFAEDSRMRMAIIRDRIARHEMEVAKFYVRRGAWLAAANRALYVLRHFQNTEQVPGALEIMIEAYGEMGLEAEQRRAQEVFEMNFPDKIEG